jgi:tRNA-Thr(GGU) m(6)t(6)A37 methyltransferase TsaA
MQADLANDMREGEVAVPLPSGFDAGVYFIGRIRTPWRERHECPRQGDPVAGPVCRIETFAPWSAALAGIGTDRHLEILYWMHQARRDLVLQTPRHGQRTTGTFALRSPVRPNPIALSRVAVVALGDTWLDVRGLDCVDATPLIDIKPEVCPNASLAGLRPR